jgi:ABC-type proline/glycine betaine transport system substrate-binding protein
MFIITTAIATLLACATPTPMEAPTDSKMIKFTEMVITDETKVPSPSMLTKKEYKR